MPKTITVLMPWKASRRHPERRAALFVLVCCCLPAIPARPQSIDGDWSMPGKDFSSTRFSGLMEITPENAKHLQVAFTFSPGVARGHESAPIEVAGTLYLVSAYPNVLYALDL